MTDTDEQLEVVTEAEVRLAEAEANEAEALVVVLEERVIDGDDSVTADHIDAQVKLSGYAKLRAEGTRRKAERYRIAVRRQALRDLRDEIRSGLPTSGDELVKALRTVDAAARAFYALGEKHDARLREWAVRIEELKVSPGQLEEGVGLNGIGQVVIGGSALDLVDAGRHLNKLFQGQADTYGTLIPSDSDLRDRTFETLDAIGEGLW